MSEFERYSDQLLRAAKSFLEEGRGNPNLSDDEQRNFRASITHAFFFLEAQINYIAQHFSNSTSFDLLERSLLSERDVALSKGKFSITKKPKFYRLEDRIDFLLNRFSATPVEDKANWHSGLIASITVRNRLVHPKEAHQVTITEVETCILSVLGCLESLYRAVFGTNFPLAGLGLHPGPAKG